MTALPVDEAIQNIRIWDGFWTGSCTTMDFGKFSVVYRLFISVV